MFVAASARRLALTLVVGLLAVLGLVTVFSRGNAAHAGPPYPPKTPCAVSGSSGDGVSFTGSGFPADSSVRLTTNAGAVSVIRSDGNGSFRAQVAVPAGQRVVTAVAGTTRCNVSGSGVGGENIGPGPKAVSDPGASSSDGTTATTGFAALSASAIALLLLVGGTMFVLIGRRRNAG